MQLIHSIDSCPFAISGTVRDETTVAYVRNQEKAPASCRTAKLSMIPAKTQESVTVKIPAAGLRIAEMYPHVLRGRLAMVVRGVREVVRKIPFTMLVANWSNVFITLPKNMLVAQCSILTDTFRPQPYEGDGINMTQVYEKV